MVSKSKRKKVYQRAGGHCEYCGKPLSMRELTIDHVVPSSKGGGDNIGNLKACCLKCNRTKNQGSTQFLRLALAWPHLAISEMTDFGTAMLAAKKYKFYYELA